MVKKLNRHKNRWAFTCCMLLSIGIVGCQPDENNQPDIPAFAAPNIVVATPQADSDVDLSGWLNNSQVSITDVRSLPTNPNECGPATAYNEQRFSRAQSETVVCQYEYTLTLHQQGDAWQSFEDTGVVTTLVSTNTEPALTSTSLALWLGDTQDVSVSEPGYTLENIMVQGAISAVANLGTQSISLSADQGTGLGEVHYTMVNTSDTDDRMFGVIYTSVSVTGIDGPIAGNGEVPNGVTAPTRVYVDQVVTISIKDFVNEGDMDWQLTDVQSLTATTYLAPPPDDDGQHISFTASTEGIHIVQYVISDFSGNYSVGLLSVTVTAPKTLIDSRRIVGTRQAFAAIADDGTIKAWGHNDYGGNQSDVAAVTDVKAIYSTGYAFAAIYGDENRVWVWGADMFGGNQSDVIGLKDVKAIYSTNSAFAAVYGDENRVWIWGNLVSQGDVDGLRDVKAVYSTFLAFAAVYGDENRVWAWGRGDYGGDQSDVDGLTDVKMVYSTTQAFAAIYGDDRKVLAWGADVYGGNQHDVAALSDVHDIYPGSYAFAAVYGDENRAWVWGDDSYGGNSNDVAGLKDVITMSSTQFAFAAVYGDESRVKVWGLDSHGGAQADVDGLTDVSAIYSTAIDFAALYGDERKVKVWGLLGAGSDQSAVDSLSDIKGIFSTETAFAAVYGEEYKVQTWGDHISGGRPSDVDGLDTVNAVFSNAYAFATTNWEDGSVFVWGKDENGGRQSDVDELNFTVTLE